MKTMAEIMFDSHFPSWDKEANMPETNESELDKAVRICANEAVKETVQELQGNTPSDQCVDPEPPVIRFAEPQGEVFIQVPDSDTVEEFVSEAAEAWRAVHGS
ncbi:MAG: hypothetical protein V3W44_09925 [Dehalococcoidales bacterium]